MIQRYVFGGRGSSWSGYCEYDPATQQYRYFNDPQSSLPSYGWTDLTQLRLDDLIRDGNWKSDMPPDQQLPQGF